MNSNQDRELNKHIDNEQERELDKHAGTDANRDPISGEPGAHPVGTGIGAATAGAIGTMIGAAGGPAGAAIGAVVGSVVGGLIGKNTAEAFDPTVEDAYWRENYSSRPYAKRDFTYEDYQPAYRTGYEGYNRYRDAGRSYHEVEPELRRSYETEHSSARVGWEDAKHAVQDAFDRVRDSSLSNSEDEYWRQQYASQPYYEQGLTYEAYQPAYRTGYESYSRYASSGRTFDDVEPELRSDYERNYGSTGMGWDKAKHAARDAWNRVERTFSRNR